MRVARGGEAERDLRGVVFFAGKRRQGVGAEPAAGEGFVVRLEGAAQHAALDEDFADVPGGGAAVVLVPVVQGKDAFSDDVQPGFFFDFFGDVFPHGAVHVNPAAR